VLEHTHHPVELIKFPFNLLTTEGIIYIEVPNLKSGCAKIFGKYWKGYYVPRHIFHFTKESLNEILRLAGLYEDITDIKMPLMGNTFSILLVLTKLIYLSGLWVFYYIHFKSYLVYFSEALQPCLQGAAVKYFKALCVFN